MVLEDNAAEWQPQPADTSAEIAGASAATSIGDGARASRPPCRFFLLVSAVWFGLKKSASRRTGMTEKRRSRSERFFFYGNFNPPVLHPV